VKHAIAFFLLACLTGPIPAQESGDPLLWGADLEGGMPYVYRDKDDPNKLVGFEVDLAAALSKDLNRPIKFKQYQFDQLLNGLIRGDFDFAMNGLEISPERKKLVCFIRPYYVYHQQLTVRADEQRFKTLLGCLTLKECTIATLSGTAAERLLTDKREKYAGLTVRGYESPAEAYSELERGRADAVLMDAMIAQYYADPTKLRSAGRPTARGEYGIAFRKEDQELADKVDAALGRIMDSGELRDIYRHWGLWNDAQEELMPNYLFEENDKEGTAVPGSEPAPKARSQETTASGSPFWTDLKLLGQGAWITVKLTALSFLVAVLLAASAVVSAWQAVRATAAGVEARDDRDRARSAKEELRGALYDIEMSLLPPAWDADNLVRFDQLLEHQRDALHGRPQVVRIDMDIGLVGGFGDRRILQWAEAIRYAPGRRVASTAGAIEALRRSSRPERAWQRHLLGKRRARAQRTHTPGGFRAGGTF